MSMVVIMAGSPGSRASKVEVPAFLEIEAKRLIDSVEDCSKNRAKSAWNVPSVKSTYGTATQPFEKKSLFKAPVAASTSCEVGETSKASNITLSPSWLHCQCGLFTWEEMTYSLQRRTRS